MTNPGLWKTKTDMRALQHCPDFVERHSLLDGVTAAIPYPKAGFNCQRDYGVNLVQDGPRVYNPAPVFPYPPGSATPTLYSFDK